MKQSVKILALICALILLVSLAACGDKKDDSAAKKSDDSGSSDVNEPASDLTDFGWVKFKIPEGWADNNESPAYVTVVEDADSHHIVKLFGYTYGTLTNPEDLAKNDAEKDPDRYTVDEPVEIGGRTWYPVRFTFNDVDSVRLFGEVDGEHYCYVTIFEQSENDPAVQTILNSIEFDASQID